MLGGTVRIYSCVSLKLSIVGVVDNCGGADSRHKRQSGPPDRLVLGPSLLFCPGEGSPHTAVNRQTPHKEARLHTTWTTAARKWWICRNEPKVGRHNTRSGRNCRSLDGNGRNISPNLADTCNKWPNMTRISSNRNQPMLAEYGPTLAAIVHDLVEHSLMFVEHSPKSVEIAPTLAESGRIWPNKTSFDRRQSKVGRNQPHLVESSPHLWSNAAQSG